MGGPKARWFSANRVQNITRRAYGMFIDHISSVLASFLTPEQHASQVSFGLTMQYGIF